jgi:hypothetical protein
LALGVVRSATFFGAAAAISSGFTLAKVLCCPADDELGEGSDRSLIRRIDA